MTTIRFDDDFAAALLAPARPTPAGLTAWNGSDPAQRFAVYRNNVTVALIDAVADTFPVTCELVGDDFFRAMAREFVRAEPPDSPVLAWYGETFPAFVERFGPAASVPYLADVARLEYARVQAFHAPDSGVPGNDEIATLLADPERLARTGIVLAPSVGLLRSPWAIVSVWSAHQGMGDLADIDPERPENALVSRCRQQVEVRSLTQGDAAFVHRLAAGDTLEEATRQANELPGFELTGILGVLLVAGAVSDFHTSCRGT